MTGMHAVSVTYIDRQNHCRNFTKQTHLKIPDVHEAEIQLSFTFCLIF